MIFANEGPRLGSIRYDVLIEAILRGKHVDMMERRRDAADAADHLGY